MIELRELTTPEELQEVNALETRIWATEIVPPHLTITNVKNGGIMIGAYADGKLCGFSYGFPGFRDGEVYLCSHMLGVDEPYRSCGIGEKLKQKQREIALRKGYRKMNWTFDPLETRNAYLNLTKLHGITHTYIENCYGDMEDGLNQGLPSDRLELHWHLESPHVTGREISFPETIIPFNSITFTKDELPVYETNHIGNLTAEAYSLLVPKDFQHLKQTNKNRALDWRLKTRYAFQRLFQAGFTAVELRVMDQYAAYIFIK
ncbi:GNAT family N-acetyltransferase [Oceanobacillus alkalisoli]|uniref:GNAT family N-acetyltransferase n=1 Tax=Oceanobacillus alkalisoli TaxID=2925113 RepID=UPI001F11E96A|nr:GNAT family N-acetyltransferase [Oceanobacillus alkalisoli]MCF3944241.1 GNAT family N-acetyltransferase [Oceanobacillus alkalisoli]